MLHRLVVILTLFALGVIGCKSTADVEALKKFGATEFSKKAWAPANATERSHMVYAFLKTYQPITNLTRDTLLSELGNSTAYYEYDEFPAYEISDGTKRYLLAFVVDHNTGKVKDFVFEDYPQR